jgi:FixJ family two-component response regulator
LSGIELHTILRERGVHAPVIFLTGSADVPTAVAAMRNGAADFLEKPFQSSELVARVRQAYRRHEVPVIPTAVTTMSELVNSLTPREREVLDLLITGATSKLMAKSLGGSFRTIETHRGRVMAKMGANCLAELVRMCMDLPPLKRALAKRP